MSAILPEIVKTLVFKQNAVKFMVALTTKLALNTKDGVLLFHAEFIQVVQISVMCVQMG